MCGIIGYIGFRKASEVILRALRALEYRGYDSAGIAIHNKKKIKVKKGVGKVDVVADSLKFTSLEGRVGIGHTRWASHGIVCKENAHPHSSCAKNIVLVHNGIIENYLPLKEQLLKAGHKFESETDSEVIAHLIEENTKTKSFECAFVEAVKKLKGSYAIVALELCSEKIFAAKKNSPLLLGIGKKEYFIASDIPAILPYTKKVIPIEDEHFVFLSSDEYKIINFKGKEVKQKIMEVDWNIEAAEKGGFPNFMFKEIHEQKLILYESLAANVMDAKKLIGAAKCIHIVACGTSYHAAIVFSILLEKYFGKNAKAFIASEYQFVANPNKDTLIIAISQSGETADTLQAVKFAKKTNVKILSLTNVICSSLARISDSVVYLNAGPEISVAATKTFSSQLTVIYKIIFANDLSKIPEIVARALKEEQKVKKVSLKLKKMHEVFFLGRGLSYPIAMEGALKFKELSYIYAEAYPAGELKHGPLSLIKNKTPIIVLAPNDQTLAKIHSNIKEVKARGAFVIALTDSPEIRKEVDIVLDIEKTNAELYPFAMLPLLQLLACYTSILKGIDPDKPRNLAKSVTIE